MAKIEAGKMDLEIVPVRTIEPVEEVVYLLGPSAKEKGTQLPGPLRQLDPRDHPD